MRIVIAEDSVLLRDGLTRLLTDGGFEVVEAVPDAGQLLRAVSEHQPDLAVIDVRMPPTYTDEGIRAALVIRRQFPESRCWCCPSTWRRATPPTCCPTRPARSATCSRTGWRTCGTSWTRCAGWPGGGTALDPEVVAQLLVRRRDDPLDRLTPREQQVLRLMAEGKSNTGIVEALKVSPSAVEKYVTNIFTQARPAAHRH
jgi:DNA-binding NarL/FixJ family response regulator